MILSFQQALADAYPGRGLILGRAGGRAVCAYFIMGRSPASRNRVLASGPEGVYTRPCTQNLLYDPTLTIYQAVHFLPDRLVAGNGDHTNDIVRAGDLRRALDLREYEPDAPIYTSRIAGVDHLSHGPVELAVLSRGRDGACVRRYYSYDGLPDGAGLLIHTYAPGVQPFESMPVRVKLSGGAAEIAGALWPALDAANRISLYVRCTDLATGEAQEETVNKYQMRRG